MNDDLLIELNQYLTFTLGNELFAFEISKVREVVDYIQITRVPRMPEYFKGVMNLRGNVISVIDLRLKLGMSSTEKTVDTCIVLAEVIINDEPLQMGVLVDLMQEVIHLNPDMIEPAPKIGIKLDTEFIRGIGKRENAFINIFNIETVLSTYEWEEVQKVKESPLPTLDFAANA